MRFIDSIAGKVSLESGLGGLRRADKGTEAKAKEQLTGLDAERILYDWTTQQGAEQVDRSIVREASGESCDKMSQEGACIVRLGKRHDTVGSVRRCDQQGRRAVWDQSFDRGGLGRQRVRDDA